MGHMGSSSLDDAAIELQSRRECCGGEWKRLTSEDSANRSGVQISHSFHTNTGFGLQETEERTETPKSLTGQIM